MPTYYVLSLAYSTIWQQCSDSIQPGIFPARFGDIIMFILTTNKLSTYFLNSAVKKIFDVIAQSWKFEEYLHNTRHWQKGKQKASRRQRDGVSGARGCRLCRTCRGHRRGGHPLCAAWSQPLVLFVQTWLSSTVCSRPFALPTEELTLWYG